MNPNFILLTKREHRKTNIQGYGWVVSYCQEKYAKKLSEHFTFRSVAPAQDQHHPTWQHEDPATEVQARNAGLKGSV